MDHVRVSPYFHAISPEDASAVVNALTEREVPLLWRIGDRTRVLGANLSAKDKTLALLYGTPGACPVRTLLVRSSIRMPASFAKKC